MGKLLAEAARIIVQCMGRAHPLRISTATLSGPPRMTGVRAAIASLLLLGAAAPVADAAPRTLTQDEVLARWADALGGRARLAALRSVHMIATLEMGGAKGRFESWFTARSERRDVIDIPGLLHQEVVFEGTHGWAVDSKGAVHALTGSELADQVTSVYQATYAWLLPGRLRGEVAFAGETPDHTGYLLAIHPLNGTPYDVILDGKTFLPQRLTQRGQDRSTVQTLSNWRAVGGIRFPWQAHQSTGDPQLDVEFSVETIEFDPTLSPRLFAEPRPVARKP